MIAEPVLLFIYGTLHPDRAPASIAPVTRLLSSLGRATISGHLYQLGDYPGVVLSPASTGRDPTATIPGELFLLPADPAASSLLARLDAYEDFRPSDPAGSLFLRQLTTATLEDGIHHLCWVYTWNGPTPISAGDSW